MTNYNKEIFETLTFNADSYEVCVAHDYRKYIDDDGYERITYNYGSPLWEQPDDVRNAKLDELREYFFYEIIRELADCDIEVNIEFKDDYHVKQITLDKYVGPVERYVGVRLSNGDWLRIDNTWG